VGNVMNQVNAFGLQPFVNLTLQGRQVGSLEYLHFHSVTLQWRPSCGQMRVVCRGRPKASIEHVAMGPLAAGDSLGLFLRLTLF
jgi:hypothetical protein